MDQEVSSAKSYPQAQSSQPSADSLYRFEALARWKAFEITHGHTDMEDTAGVQSTLSRIGEALVDYQAEVKRIVELPPSKGSKKPDTDNILFPYLNLSMAHPQEWINAEHALNAELAPAFEELWSSLGMERKIETWGSDNMLSDLARLAALDTAECRGTQMIWRSKGYAARLEPQEGSELLRHNLPPNLSIATAEYASDDSSFHSHISRLSTPRMALSDALDKQASGFSPSLGNPFEPASARSKQLGFIEALRNAVDLGSGAFALRAFGQEAFSESVGRFLFTETAKARAELLGPMISKFRTQTALFAGVRENIKTVALEQSRQWLENVGAWSFCQKYWGDSWSEARFGDIETALAHRAELELAFNGNPGLGRVSAFMGGRLGLLPKGDLPQRCFERLSELGLTRSGWKFLGKLDDSLKTLTDQFRPEKLLSYEAPESGLLEDLAPVPLAETASISWKSRLAQTMNPVPELEGPEADAQLATLDRFSSALRAEVAGKNALALRVFCLTASAAASTRASPALFADALRRLDRLASAAYASHSPETARTLHLKQLDSVFETIACGFFLHASSSPEAAYARIDRAMDFARDAEPGAFAVFEGLGPKQAWAKLGKLESEWHEMIQLRERGERSHLQWEPLAAAWPSDPSRGLIFRELVDGGALFDEGKALHHCVSSYAETCVQGTCRILSLERDGARSGTLELVRDGDQWSIGQFNEHCNAPIRDEACVDMAQAALRAANSAQAKLDAGSLSEVGFKLASKRALFQPPAPLLGVIADGGL